MCKKIVYILILLMILSIFLSLPARTGEAAKRKVITNNDIIKMVEAELSEDIVISLINSSEVKFDISADGLINLKNKGVSYKLVEAMIDADSMTRNAPVQQQPRQTYQPQRSEQNAAQPRNEAPLGNNEYYARCNLKVFKGSNISWINWQSTQTMIPVGTRLRVASSGKKATLTDVNTGASYTLDVGASGDEYLNKFVTRQPVSIASFPPNFQADIKDGWANIGMTKEQVYIAMGPPAMAGVKTRSSNYDRIMSENLWIFKRSRFGKNLGVEFDPNTGLVKRTEGFWGR